MTRHLLDVNVLIALIDPAHVQHDQVHEWFGRVGHKAFANCPITENGLLRVFMLRVFSTASLLLLGSLFPALSMAASPVHKCDVNGKVTYQSSPCPSGEQAPHPTVEQLNGERKRRSASAASASVTGESKAEAIPKPVADPVTPPSEIKSSFRCDGRKYCSQMTSCAEATYFLSNCPGVKMDGDGNGVPCERQWCNR